MIVAAEVVAGFRDTFGGEVLGPEDSGYDTARSVWNGDIDRRPALIVRPRTISEVAAALGLARSEGLEVSVRGGGHSYAGHAVCDDGLMIDLSAMSEVSVDAESRRARCGGGATWLHLDAATQAHGLGVTGGFISHTGVGGLTLGGGMGWLTRRAGLTCDNLVSAEVVTADGQTVTASAESNPDLFWALRGGGGNFGIVTSFEFALHEVPPLANLGLFFWDPAHGREGLRFARDLVATLPEDMGALVAGLSAPPAPFVPPEYQGQPGFVLAVVGWGSAEDHAAVLEPVTSSAPEPQWQMISPIPYTQLQQMFDESAPWGALAYEKALYLDDLSEEVIDIFADFLPRKASPLSFVPVFPMGGAFNRVAEEDTAFGGSRRTGWVFNISAACLTPEMLDADRAWVRDFWAAMRPHSAGPGGYVNFLSDADQDRVRASYGKDKYERLARIKAHWDPENIFHRNANIRPTV